MSNFKNLISQIKKTFSHGKLHDYLTGDSKHKPEKVEKFLQAIADGNDEEHKSTNAQMKAKVLLRQLQLHMEDGTLHDD